LKTNPNIAEAKNVERAWLKTDIREPEALRCMKLKNQKMNKKNHDFILLEH
jgi:hypothetical protein